MSQTRKILFNVRLEPPLFAAIVALRDEMLQTNDKADMSDAARKIIELGIQQVEACRLRQSMMNDNRRNDNGR